MPTEAVQETPLLVENTTAAPDGLHTLDWSAAAATVPPPLVPVGWALAGAQVAPPLEEKAI